MTVRPRSVRTDNVEQPSPKMRFVSDPRHVGQRTASGFVRASRYHPLLFGLLRPKRPILGTELAGEWMQSARRHAVCVVTTSSFTPNFGRGARGYICWRRAPRSRTACRMTFEEAAAVTDGMILALMCLEAAMSGSERIVVYGASGATAQPGSSCADTWRRCHRGLHHQMSSW